MLIILFLLSNPLSDYEQFFKENASPLSLITEKSSPPHHFLTILGDYKSFSLPAHSENNFGFGILLSFPIYSTRLGFGYSYYPKTERSIAKDFLHLSFSYPLLKKPELNVGLRYGLNCRELFFLPGNPYTSYKINSFYSFGLVSMITYPIWKFKPYLNAGISLSHLKGEFIEDLRERKTSYSRIFGIPKLEFGLLFSRLSLRIQYGKRPGVTLGFHLGR